MLMGWYYNEDADGQPFSSNISDGEHRLYATTFLPQLHTKISIRLTPAVFRIWDPVSSSRMVYLVFGVVHLVLDIVYLYF